jgi:hypothetical protein
MSRTAPLKLVSVVKCQSTIPDGYYCEYQHFAMVWPYDEQGRLKGEHVYENTALHRIEPIAHEDSRRLIRSAGEACR